MFPILMSHDAGKKVGEARKSGCAVMVVALPWEMIAPHEDQVQKNHSQSLKRLAERGGLGWCEAVAVLEDRPWGQMLPPGSANARLVELLDEFRARIKEVASDE
jgi:hypothetical protein